MIRETLETKKILEEEGILLLLDTPMPEGLVETLPGITVCLLLNMLQLMVFVMVK